MLLWFVAALGFLVCVAAWHFWHGITWEEAGTVFVAAALIFAVHLKYIYDEATTDHYLVTGYVTSLVHHPAYHYETRAGRVYVPEAWIIEQRPQPPAQIRTISYPIHNGDGIEYCYGECQFSYPKPPYKDYSPGNSGDTYAYPISVDRAKFIRTSLSDTSAVWRTYFNPVQISDEIIYNDGDNIPYFKTDDYNRAHRLIAPQATAAQEEVLEKINAKLSPHHISVGLIVASDNLYFEKLKRAWHQGKANDFVIVVNSPDGRSIRNVNILGWNNYTLKENVSGAIMALPSAHINGILSAIWNTLRQGQDFVVADFSKYHFLDVKIPEKFYIKIILFQIAFGVYMLLLLRFDPNTKDKKLPLSDVVKMWSKKFRPPDSSWYLHPFTPTGLVLYIGVPVFLSTMMF